MESATTVTLVLAGLFFSLACALLMEELIFGGLFRFFFARAGDAPQNTTIAERKLNPHQPKEG